MSPYCYINITNSAQDPKSGCCRVALNIPSLTGAPTHTHSWPSLPVQPSPLETVLDCYPFYPLHWVLLRDNSCARCNKVCKPDHLVPRRSFQRPPFVWRSVCRTFGRRGEMIQVEVFDWSGVFRPSCEMHLAKEAAA